MKSFLSSKINWSAFLVILMGLQDAITSQDFSVMTKKDWATFAIGVLIMVFRTWFTSTQISGVGNNPK